MSCSLSLFSGLLHVGEKCYSAEWQHGLETQRIPTDEIETFERKLMIEAEALLETTRADGTLDPSWKLRHWTLALSSSLN